MGLDMYLMAKKYVGGWDHSTDEEKAAYQAITAAVGLPGYKAQGSPHLEVELCVIYWRKANQVHNWFVQNVQSGTDDCHEHYVERDQLATLATLCETVLASSKLVPGTVTNGFSSQGGGPFKPNLEQGKVIENPAVAQEVLPCESGFFFGGQEYDQWYYEDVKRTAEKIRELLKLPSNIMDGWSFYYRSSW